MYTLINHRNVFIFKSSKIIRLSIINDRIPHQYTSLLSSTFNTVNIAMFTLSNKIRKKSI